MSVLASDWLRQFRLLLWNRWTEFNETLQEARSQRSFQSLSFSCRSEKQDCCPGLWLAEIFSTSLKPLNGFQRNLTWSKISTSSTKFVFFGPISKQKGPPWSIPLWHVILRCTICGNLGLLFSSPEPKVLVSYYHSASSVRHKLSRFRPLFWNHYTQFNDRKQDLSALYQVWVFRANRKKMTALVTDWLRHFRLHPLQSLNGIQWIWQEARSQRPLPSLSFWADRKKQDSRPGLWLAETFSTSPLKPLNGIQRNFIGNQISTSSTTFVFFVPIEKRRWPPWLLIGWDIFDFSSETAEWISTQLDRKQDRNILYQVCIFLTDQ